MDSCVGELLRTALGRACSALPIEVRAVPLEHWNESIFRFLLVRHILAAAPGTPCWSEWHRVDLVLPASSGATLVELKFFAHQPLRDHSDGVLRMKGGPSAQNVREFEAAIQSLAGSRAKHWATACGGIAAGYVVLAYCDPAIAGAQRTYRSHYGNLRAHGQIASVETIVEELPLPKEAIFTCKLLALHLAPAA